jgi:membrane-bound lytic murein transglycosylase D
MNALSTQTCPAPTIRVRFTKSGVEQSRLVSVPFRIGRLPECGLCIESDYVGRIHAEVVCEGGVCWIRDLNSRNGIYLDGQRAERIALAGSISVKLGISGPELHLEPVVPSTPPPAAGDTTARFVEHYFGNSAGEAPVGEHTVRVRRAFAQVQSIQKLKHRRIVAILLLAIASVAGFAFYENQQIRRQKAMAKDLFYAIKSLDVDIANLEKVAAASGTENGAQVIQSYENRRRDLEKNYDRFLATLHVYDRPMTEQQRIMLRVARIFGECELDMPPGFEAEINKYINTWRSSGRLAAALHTADSRGYTNTITKELLAQGLPPQFFYLALQESNFDALASGPVTRHGIAKGMWQFMPDTAVFYGLKLGPLVELRQPDPRDERQQYAKATNAAARYLKDIYSTDAQASGFLVMASYNWGENRVIPLIRSLPANPRERNFWKLLGQHRSQIPQETYDYVFSIVSAAVIGENPRLFGFDFDNPLSHISE